MGVRDFLRRLAPGSATARPAARQEPPAAPPPPPAPPAARVASLPFSIEWRRRPDDEPLSLERPSLVVSAEPDVPPSEVESLLPRCRAAGRSLAIVAPSPPAALADELRSLGVALFDATDQPGQPASALLGDLAVYSGAACLSKELGWTLRITPDKDYSPLVMPTWLALQVEDTGDLLRLDYTPGRLTLVGSETASARIQRHILRLGGSLVADDLEAAGRQRRLARLGAPAVEVGKAPAPRFELGDGRLQVPSGYRSPYLITEALSGEARLAHPSVLLLREPLLGWRDMALLLLSAMGDSAGSPVFIAAPRVSDEALAVLVVNKLRGIVQGLAVEVKDETALDAMSDFSRASPAPLDFDPGARRGAVASVSCDVRRVLLSR